MLTEINEVQRYFVEKYPNENAPDDVYSIPVKTSKGEAFMKITIENNNFKKVSDNFTLWFDESLTKSWYD